MLQWVYLTILELITQAQDLIRDIRSSWLKITLPSNGCVDDMCCDAPPVTVSVVTAACLVGVAQSRCSPVAVLVWCAMGLALGMSAAFSSFFANVLELAPNHAAAVMGVSGTARAVVQVLSPLYVAYLTEGQVSCSIAFPLEWIVDTEIMDGLLEFSKLMLLFQMHFGERHFSHCR